MIRTLVRCLLAMALLGLVAGCATQRAPSLAVPPPAPSPERDGPPPEPFDWASIPEQVPRPEPRARYGNHSPYEVFGRRYYVLDDARGYRERGIASWYGTKFHGRLTSTREVYDMYQYTAAHRTLPLPSYARVTNLANGRSVIVRINDRGPFVGDRLIDLSYAAAKRLDLHMHGTGWVEVEAIVVEDPAPPVEERGRYFVQVGAFGTEANALRLKAELQRAGHRAVRVARAERDGRSVFRVQLGPFHDRADADRASQRLFAIGWTQAVVIAP